jgi:hypothetical protein
VTPEFGTGIVGDEQAALAHGIWRRTMSPEILIPELKEASTPELASH